MNVKKIYFWSKYWFWNSDFGVYYKNINISLDFIKHFTFAKFFILYIDIFHSKFNIILVHLLTMFRSDTHSDIFRSENVEKSKVTRTQILASLAVSLGSMIVGFFSAWSSPAIASLMEPKSHIVVSKQNFWKCHNNFGIQNKFLRLFICNYLC